jgi:hypothetical protein
MVNQIYEQLTQTNQRKARKYIQELLELQRIKRIEADSENILPITPDVAAPDTKSLHLVSLIKK